MLYVKLLLLFEVRGFYLISWMDSSLDAEDVLISGELCALLILLGLGLALAGLEGLLCGLVVSRCNFDSLRDDCPRSIKRTL